MSLCAPLLRRALAVAAMLAASLATAVPNGHAPTLDEKIGQMIMLGFPGTTPVEPWPHRALSLLAKGKIGGVLLLGGNVRSPRQLEVLTRAVHRAAGPVPPFVAVDQEGGLTARLSRDKGFRSMPSAAAIAAGRDLAAARATFLGQARELARYGINVNFGPVVDLDLNAANPIIGRRGRSYGTTPGAVVPFAQAFIEAHREAGVLTAIKHFPGHGSSAGDTHAGTVDVGALWREEELVPFRALAGEDGAPMVMVSHIVHPRFSDGGNPASLSKAAIRRVLRGELGYDGVVVTDDLHMEAVAARYRIETAAVMAVAAGSDIILVSNYRLPDPTVAERITAALRRAIKDGTIDVADIEASYARIMRLKGTLARHRDP